MPAANPWIPAGCPRVPMIRTEPLMALARRSAVSSLSAVSGRVASSWNSFSWIGTSAGAVRMHYHRIYKNVYAYTVTNQYGGEEHGRTDRLVSPAEPGILLGRTRILADRRDQQMIPSTQRRSGERRLPNVWNTATEGRDGWAWQRQSLAT